MNYLGLGSENNLTSNANNHEDPRPPPTGRPIHRKENVRRSPKSSPMRLGEH